MHSFRKFLKNSEEEDVQKTLNKIPKSHRNLIKGFEIKFHGGNTLDGDDEHVGYMDAREKEIAVAAPYNYPREFSLLHEIAHTVYEAISNNLKQKWAKLVNKTKDKQKNKKDIKCDSLNQSAEEIFCMCYANYYTRHKLMTYDNPEWMAFIKNLPY